MRQGWWFGLLLLMFSSSATAGDQLREADYANALQQTGLQTLHLSANQHDFLALYQAAEPGVQQAVIMLHDMGGNPDQSTVINGLRQQLPVHHWHSLSIQLPLRESGADEADYYPLFDEAKARVDAALLYLQQQRIRRVALVGYGLGALMATYVAQAEPTHFAALVAISLSMPHSSLPQVQVESFLKALTLPVLDVYAEFDSPAVLTSASSRRLLGSENPVYRQIKMDGLDHLYQTNSDLLIKRVHSWLNSVDQ